MRPLSAQPQLNPASAPPQPRHQPRVQGSFLGGGGGGPAPPPSPPSSGAEVLEAPKAKVCDLNSLAPKASEKIFG